MTHALQRPVHLSVTALALGALLAGASLAVAAAPAQAATLSVTTTADALDASALCSTVTPAVLPGPDGVVSLREAVCAANTNPGADTVTLPAGVYTLTGAANDDDGRTGDLDVVPTFGPNSLTIEGAGSGVTVIDGGGVDRIFDAYSFAGEVDLTLRNLTLRNGSVPGGNGGAISTFLVDTMLDNVVVESSSASTGGGISSIYGTLTIFESEVRGNSATGGAGGILVDGVLQMQASTVASNSADIGGGLVLHSDDTEVSTIEQSTIWSNTAQTAGGGIALDALHKGQTVISDSTLSGNSSAGVGGAVYAAGDSAGEILLSSATVLGNSAAINGGVYQVSGFVIVQHSIVAQNTGGDLAGVVGTVGNIVGVAGGGVIDGVSGNRAGSASGPLDPMLRPLGLYGGTTLTHVPLPGSPAIDTGLACGAIDQRWESRIVGAGCDVGAVEVTAAPDTALLTGPVATTTIAAADFTFSASGGAGGGGFECSVDGGGYTSCTSPASFTVGDGAHTLRVRAVDALGATDPSAAEWAWTTALPVASGGGPTEIAATGADTAAHGGLAAALLLLGGALLFTARRRRHA